MIFSEPDIWDTKIQGTHPMLAIANCNAVVVAFLK
jgi:hypothetical protein